MKNMISQAIFNFLYVSALLNYLFTLLTSPSKNHRHNFNSCQNNRQMKF